MPSRARAAGSQNRCAPSRAYAPAYAAHSLNETVPGGPAFSAKLNYQQMRRFGASPAVASWGIALSGSLSACALAVVTLAGALAAGGGPDWRHLGGLLVAVVVLTLGVRRISKHPELVEPLLRTPLALLNRLRRRPLPDDSERVRGFLEQLRAARRTAPPRRPKPCSTGSSTRPAYGCASASWASLRPV